jgi:hypothetical protein
VRRHPGDLAALAVAAVGFRRGAMAQAEGRVEADGLWKLLVVCRPAAWPLVLAVGWDWQTAVRCRNPAGAGQKIYGTRPSRPGHHATRGRTSPAHPTAG